MDTLIDAYIKSHPDRAAKVLEGLETEQLKQFSLEADESLNDVLARVSPTTLAKVISLSRPNEIAQLLQRLPNLQAAMLLKLVPQETRQAVLQGMPENRRIQVERHLQFEHTQIGFYAVMPKLVLTDSSTVEDALKAAELVNTNDLPLWVVDSKYKLVGQVDLLKLIAARESPELKLEKVIETEVNWVSGQTKIESIAELILKAGKRSIAVVGQDKAMLGIISHRSLKNRTSVSSGQRSSSVEEYIYFSEMLWTGLNKFWGSLK